MTNFNTSTAQAVLEALKKENVEYIFGLTGSHVLSISITDALVDVPEIRHIVAKHESNAAYMAGMYGYLTGRPGVVLVTAGPGATNSISGVAQDLLAEADFVLAMGMRSKTLLTDILVEHGSPSTILVALDEPGTLQPVHGLAVAETADTKLFLAQILEYSDEFQGSSDSSRRTRVVQHRQAYKNCLRPWLELWN